MLRDQVTKSNVILSSSWYKITKKESTNTWKLNLLNAFNTSNEYQVLFIFSAKTPALFNS